MSKTPVIAINSQDYWVKVVGMLQQNWALINRNGDGACSVFFISDDSGVFDQLAFRSTNDAREALNANGFARFSADSHLQSFLVPPLPPFREGGHPNGKIYSSGRFWMASPSHTARKRMRATLILKIDDAILLVVTRKGLVLLPGGGLSKGELPIVGAARELHEETGLVATSLTYLFQHESESNLHHVFLAEASGKPVAGDSAVRLEYLSDLATDYALNLSPATRSIITRFEKRLASLRKIA